MIIYNPKKWCGWKVLCSKSGCSGSVAPRAALYGLVAALIALIIKLDQEFEWGVFGALHHTTREESLFDHPYSLHIWGAALGFMLVFRGNLGYARHWEGRREIGRMSSYLQDVAMNGVCYDEANKDINQYREWKQVRPPTGLAARGAPCAHRSLAGAEHRTVHAGAAASVVAAARGGGAVPAAGLEPGQPDLLQPPRRLPVRRHRSRLGRRAQPQRRCALPICSLLLSDSGC